MHYITVQNNQESMIQELYIPTLIRDDDRTNARKISSLTKLQACTVPVYVRTYTCTCFSNSLARVVAILYSSMSQNSVFLQNYRIYNNNR